MRSEAWFVQMEAQFALKGVTSVPRVFFQSRDCKSGSSNLLRLTNHTRLQRGSYSNFLLSMSTRGMKLIAGDMKPSKLISSMSLKCLPADIRAHLPRNNFSNPISLALKTTRAVSSSNRPRCSLIPHSCNQRDNRSHSPCLC